MYYEKKLYGINDFLHILINFYLTTRGLEQHNPIWSPTSKIDDNLTRELHRIMKILMFEKLALVE